MENISLHILSTGLGNLKQVCMHAPDPIATENCRVTMVQRIFAIKTVVLNALPAKSRHRWSFCSKASTAAWFLKPGQHASKHLSTKAVTK